MTAVIAEPVTAVVDVAPTRCDMRWQCRNRCCPPTRCPDQAAYRVTFGCSASACRHPDLALLCEACNARADTLGHVLARRPL